jgi:uncharacterized membrane protein
MKFTVLINIINKGINSFLATILLQKLNNPLFVSFCINLPSSTIIRIKQVYQKVINLYLPLKSTSLTISLVIEVLSYIVCKCKVYRIGKFLQVFLNLNPTKIYIANYTISRFRHLLLLVNELKKLL